MSLVMRTPYTYLLCLYLFTLYCPSSLLAAVPFRSIEFRHVNATYNSSYVYNHTESIANHTINGQFHLIRAIQNGINVHIDIQMRNKNAKVYHRLFFFELDACNLLKSTRITLLKKWMQHILISTNFKGRDCPVPPGAYYIKDWSFDEKIIPTFISTGDYRFRMRGYYGKFDSVDGVLIGEFELEATLS